MDKETRAKVLALLEEDEKRRLAAGAAAGHKVENHQPAYHDTTDGWVWGCTCGQHGRRAARASMMHVWFGRHVKALGLPCFYQCDGKPYRSPIYMSGPAKGLTWDEAYVRKIDINGG